MSKYLETLPQYHFDRDDFCKVFGEVFTDDEIIDIDVICGYPQNTENFLLYRWEDEFYIIHRDSGTIINWYKHLGRTNTCNKEGFTLADLKELLLLLKEDLKEDTVMNMVCKCGGKEFFTEEHGNQTGLYCSACGKWQKWLKKDEIRLFNHGVKVENASLLERLKARIEESAIKVSTVKAPHTYMKAVGTRELEKILEEELGNEDTKRHTC